MNGIRADHRYRYEWAASRLTGRVTDAGCGIGYGSYILGERGIQVEAWDLDPTAIALAKTHYTHPSVSHNVGDIVTVSKAAAVVCFEVMEHIPDPKAFLDSCGSRVLCSVPNEDNFPFDLHKPLGHLRHYTPDEFLSLLDGWDVEMFHQEGKHSPVERGFGGRTLIADARRKETST